MVSHLQERKRQGISSQRKRVPERICYVFRDYCLSSAGSERKSLDDATLGPGREKKMSSTSSKCSYPILDCRCQKYGASLGTCLSITDTSVAVLGQENSDDQKCKHIEYRCSRFGTGSSGPACTCACFYLNAFSCSHITVRPMSEPTASQPRLSALPAYVWTQL